MTTAPRNATRFRHLMSEAVVPLAAFVYTAVFLISIKGLPAESTIFPRTILIAVTLLGLAVMATEARKTVPKPHPRNPKAYTMFGLSVLFVIAMGFVGYLVSAMVFLMVALIHLGQRPLLALPVGVLLPGIIYLLFTGLFGVSL